jgi:hypothetical protein
MRQSNRHNFFVVRQITPRMGCGKFSHGLLAIANENAPAPVVRASMGFIGLYPAKMEVVIPPAA